MPAEPVLLADAIVLKLTPSGERFTQVHLLDQERGLIAALKRNRSKANGFTLDLFDQGEARLDRKPGENARFGFLADFSPRLKRSGIGRSYPALQAASWLSGLLLANPLHDENLAPTWTIAQRGLDALADGAPPHAVCLKILYLFARDEGYPVLEDWAQSLSPELRSTVRELLNRPLSEIAVPPEEQKSAFDALARYVELNTHIHLPKT